MANLAEGATGVLHCLLVPCEVLAVVAFKHYGWMIMNRVRDAQIARLLVTMRIAMDSLIVIDVCVAKGRAKAEREGREGEVLSGCSLSQYSSLALLLEED